MEKEVKGKRDIPGYRPECESKSKGPNNKKQMILTSEDIPSSCDIESVFEPEDRSAEKVGMKTRTELLSGTNSSEKSLGVMNHLSNDLWGRINEKLNTGHMPKNEAQTSKASAEAHRAGARG